MSLEVPGHQIGKPLLHRGVDNRDLERCMFQTALLGQGCVTRVIEKSLPVGLVAQVCECVVGDGEGAELLSEIYEIITGYRNRSPISGRNAQVKLPISVGISVGWRGAAQAKLSSSGPGRNEDPACPGTWSERRQSLMRHVPAVSCEQAFSSNS